MSPVARLEGILGERGDGWLVVSIGGVGLQLQVPLNLLSEAEVGDTISLYTHLSVREDAISLYGFASSAERHIFQTLIGTSGVGPRVALGLLSAMSPDELTYAISAGDIVRLVQAPGVGKKLASRIVLELQGKLAKEAPAAPPLGEDAQVIEALLGLGYSQAEAALATTKTELSADAPVEERVRLALQYFTQQ